MRMRGTLGCLPVPGLRWRFTLACGLPPILGLFVCFDPVTGVALSLHPGLCSASPSGLLLSSNHALLCIEKREELSDLDNLGCTPCKHDCAHLHKISQSPHNQFE